MATIRGALGDDEREGTGQRDAGLALSAGDILNGLGDDDRFDGGDDDDRSEGSDGRGGIG